MANHAGELALAVTLDGHPAHSRSTYQWTAGGLVLTLATVLPDALLAVEVISVYTGHSDTDTHATHLILAAEHHARTHTRAHDRDELNPTTLARNCVYDHAHHLIDTLTTPHRRVRVTVDEATFTQLEQVE